jgi:hypothetical protein
MASYEAQRVLRMFFMIIFCRFFSFVFFQSQMFAGQTSSSNLKNDNQLTLRSQMERDNLKELRYVQEFNQRLKSNQANYAENVSHSSAESNSSMKYNGAAETNWQPRDDSNWLKYPGPKTGQVKTQSPNSPAIILDQETNSKHSQKPKKAATSKTCIDTKSYLNSTLNSNDTILLKSASQVPPNMHNKHISLFEEQTDVIDLHSETSFNTKNSYKQFRNESNTNAKLSSHGQKESKPFYNYKEIKSWKDVD